MATNDSILALHGFCGDRLVMYPLCRKLRRRGYKVTNFGYRSIWKTIEHHAAKLRKAAEAIEADPGVERFHLVGHSMGSILIRVMLQEYQPEKLGRIVMIGPPNRGSHVATRFAPFFGWLSTTLCQIKDSEDSFVNSLERQIDPDHELGIIQAQTDFVVRPENTRLPEALEYVMLPGFHSSVLVRDACAMQVDHFLQHGAFAEQAAAGA